MWKIAQKKLILSQFIIVVQQESTSSYLPPYYTTKLCEQPDQQAPARRMSTFQTKVWLLSGEATS